MSAPAPTLPLPNGYANALDDRLRWIKSLSLALSSETESDCPIDES